MNFFSNFVDLKKIKAFDVKSPGYDNKILIITEENGRSIL